MKKNTVKGVFAVVGAIGAFSGLGLAGCTAPKANADVVSGCEDIIWIQPFQSTRRAICDGERRADGSWVRVRSHYTPEHYVPISCYRYSCSGGYWVPFSEARRDEYIVFDYNVVPGEPGHLINRNRF